MIDNTTLQAEYDVLSERVVAKNKELMAAQTGLKQLVDTLVDAADKERKALLQKRADLLNLVGAPDDELKVLTHRRDVANLAIFTFAESEAQEKATKFDEQIRTARLAFNAFLNERRILQNRGAERGLRNERGQNETNQEEADKKRIELDTAIAKSQAENEILKRDANRVRGMFFLKPKMQRMSSRRS